MTRLFPAFALLTVASLLAFPVTAADDEALSLVPANAVTLGMLELADMRTSPLSALLFQHFDRLSSGGEGEKFLFDAGLRPFLDVDRVVVATSPRTSLGAEPDILVIAQGRFQPERLAAALIARGAVQRNGYITFPESDRDGEDESGAVAFVSPSLTIAGNQRAVARALVARASGGTGFTSRGALAMDLDRIDRGATAWALIDVPRAARLSKGGEIETGKGRPGDALQAALKSVSTIALWAEDTGDALKLGASGLSRDPETLQLLDDALRGALAALRIAVREKSPEMVSVLRRFDIDRDSESITIEGSIPADTIRALMNRQFAQRK